MVVTVAIGLEVRFTWIGTMSRRSNTSLVVFRFVQDLKMRPGYQFEIGVCFMCFVFGVFAFAEFTRKDYFPENLFALFLGACPSLTLLLDTQYNGPLIGCLPLFADDDVSDGSNRRSVLSRLKKKAEETIARRPRRKRVAIDVEKGVICDDGSDTVVTN